MTDPSLPPPNPQPPYPQSQPPYPQGQPAYPQGQPPYPGYPPQRQGPSILKILLIVGGCVFGLMVLSGVLVGILAVAVIPQLTEAKSKMEKKQIGDIMSELQLIGMDGANVARLSEPGVRNKSGHDFYEWALGQEMMDPQMARKLVSLGTKTDSAADTVNFRSGGSGILSLRACSYTSPKAGELLRVLSRGDRTVVVTLNSRNWRNFADQGVPVAWAEGNVIEFMTFADASADWGITQAEWDDPAGKLFGKKAPFKHTYE